MSSSKPKVKVLQVFRTNRVLRSTDKTQIPAGTRVQVTSIAEGGKIRLSVRENAKAPVTAKLVATLDVLERTHRGRPKTAEVAE